MNNQYIESQAEAQALQLPPVNFTDIVALTNFNINALRQKAAEITVVSNKRDRALITSNITQLTALRSAIEKRRKELKADALAYGRKVDAEAARLTILLESIENPLRGIRQKYDDEQEAIKAEAERIERERIDTIKSRMKYIEDFPRSLVGKSSSEILALLNDKQDFLTSDQFNYEEYGEELIKLRSVAMSAINDALASRLKFEKEKAEADAQQKELARQRAEIDAERQKLEQEKRELLERQRQQEQLVEKEPAVFEIVTADEGEPLIIDATSPPAITDLPNNTNGLINDLYECAQRIISFPTLDLTNDVMVRAYRKEVENIAFIACKITDIL